MHQLAQQTLRENLTPCIAATTCRKNSTIYMSTVKDPITVAIAS